MNNNNNKPTTHTNNGGEEQPVDVETQQFTSKSSSSPSLEPPKREDFKSVSDYIKALTKYRSNKKFFNISSSVDKEVKFCNSEQEVLDNFSNIFNQEMVDSLKKLGFPKKTRTNVYSTRLNVYSRYEVSIVPFVLQRMVYGRVKFRDDKTITREKFDKLYSEQRINYSRADATVDDIKSLPHVALFRGLYQHNDEIAKTVTAGLLDTQKGENTKTLLGTGCWGDVIYMSLDINYSKSYSSNRNEYDLARGIIFNPGKLNIASFAKMPEWLHEDKAEQKLNEVLSSLDADEDLKSELIKYVVGKISGGNQGFLCMLFGFDACLGDSNQLDILNPNVVSLCKEEWM